MEMVRCPGNPVYFNTGTDFYAMTFELPFYSRPKLRVDSGQNGRCAACNSYLDAAMCKGICHFKPDVSSPHNHCAPRFGCFEKTMNSETIVHGVKGKYTRRLPTVDGRLDRAGPGSNDKPVIGQREEIFTYSTDIDGIGIGVDAGRQMTTAYFNALKFGSMREASPIGGFAAKKERQSTDAVVREIIRQQHRDFCPWIQFSRTKRRTDARIAATDDQQSHFVDLLLSDTVDFPLQGKGVERRKGKAKKQADSAVECSESLFESALDLLRRSGNSGWIGNTPMRRHWLARP